MSDSELAKLIVEFMRTRNRGELDEAFGDMRVRDYELLHEELGMILAHKGRPPNWVKR